MPSEKENELEKELQNNNTTLKKELQSKQKAPGVFLTKSAARPSPRGRWSLGGLKEEGMGLNGNRCEQRPLRRFEIDKQNSAKGFNGSFKAASKAPKQNSTLRIARG